MSFRGKLEIDREKERQKERSRKCCYDTVYDTISKLFQSFESTQKVLADEDLRGEMRTDKRHAGAPRDHHSKARRVRQHSPSLSPSTCRQGNSIVTFYFMSASITFSPSLFCIRYLFYATPELFEEVEFDINVLM